MISSISLMWKDDGLYGAYGYIRDLEYLRHDSICKPGMWRVNLLGWWGVGAHAVVDDFGKVPA